MALNVLSPKLRNIVSTGGECGMSGERRRAVYAGLAAKLGLAALLVLGSGNLDRFDATLLGYAFATLFAAFGITYRWVMWLQRPPTAMYWRRGGQLLLQNGGFGRHGLRLFQRLLTDFAGN